MSGNAVDLYCCAVYNAFPVSIMSTEAAPLNDPIVPFRRKFTDAWIAADVNALVSLATDDVVVMSPNDSTLYGNAEWKDWLEEYFMYFRLAAFSEPERNVIVNGDYATEMTTYMIAISPVGSKSRIRDDGRFLTIWKRQSDGHWKVWQMMWNSVKPIGSGTNRFIWRVMQKKARAPKGSK